MGALAEAHALQASRSAFAGAPRCAGPATRARHAAHHAAGAGDGLRPVRHDHTRQRQLPHRLVDQQPLALDIEGLVASSSSRIFAVCAAHRASRMRCFCPRRTGWSPCRRSACSHGALASISSCTEAARAQCTTSPCPGCRSKKLMLWRSSRKRAARPASPRRSCRARRAGRAASAARRRRAARRTGARGCRG